MGVNVAFGPDAPIIYVEFGSPGCGHERGF